MIAVRPLRDPAAVDRILQDPWIAPKLRHGDREPGYIDHPLLDYFGAYVGGDFVGVFTAIDFSSWEVEVHAALLRRALPHSRALGRMFLDQLFRRPELQRVTAHVLGDLLTAANYCRRLGFVDEGARRNAVVKEGRVLPVLTLGMTRSDWAGSERCPSSGKPLAA